MSVISFDAGIIGSDSYILNIMERENGLEFNLYPA
jgi:hypothetical protein